MIRLIYLILILLICNFSFAETPCELSEEYKKRRFEIFNLARSNYKECINSVSEYLYWQAVTQCKIQQEDETRDDCLHVAGRHKMVDLERYNDCDVLIPDMEEVKALFNQIVIEEDLTMCLDGQSRD